MDRPTSVEVHDSSQVFAQRLMRLFQTSRRPDGRRWTLEQIAAACTERGEPTSAQHLAQLRGGERTNPRLPLVEVLADVFDVPVTYFFADNLGHLSADLLPLLLAMSDPQIREVLAHPDFPATLKAMTNPQTRAAITDLVNQTGPGNSDSSA